MKKLLRNFVFTIIALKIVESLLGNITFNRGIKTILLTTLAITIFEYFLKPIAKLLFLPINILTLGLLRWIINVVGLYLVALIVPGFSISRYFFPGVSWQGVIIPSINFSLLASYIIVSLSLSFLVAIFRWLIKK